MTLPVVLDVAIGLVLMYLILSLAVTTIGEIVSTALNLRAKNLSRTITALIDSPAVRTQFYNHGLIASSKTASRGGHPPAETAPTPPETGAGVVAQRNAPQPKTETAPGGIPKDKEHPSYFDSRVFAMALLDSVFDAKTDPAAPGPAPVAAPAARTKALTFDDVVHAVSKLPPESKLRGVLLANLAASKADIVDLRDTVATWFDTAMARLSGDFSRDSKRYALWIGLALAVVLNADSFAVTGALWKDQALRAEMVRAATAVTADTAKPAICAQPVEADRFACYLTGMATYQDSLRPFPIGWQAAAVAEMSALAVVFKAFGLAFTGFALSFGAPFWFDLLQKFINIRGAGPKPKTLKEE